MTTDRRFATIDALRGLAAIGVMLFHVRQYVSVQVPGGYLAVDLFFALSGFVIAHSYGGRMQAGMAPREFIERRIVRLWPMLMFGAALGIVLHGGHAGMLFLLPDWRSQDMLFPMNPPLWSLLVEMSAYVAFALGGHRLSTAALAAVAAICALCWIAYAATTPGFGDLGAEWRNVAAGFVRVGYSFPIGMLIHRMGTTRFRTSSLGWLLALPLAWAFLAIGPDDTLAALLAVLLGGPALLVIAARVEVPQLRLAAFLGDASYPLYCIHLPLLALLFGAGTNAILATCAALVGVAVILERHVDRPARRWLERQRRRAQANAQTRIGIST